MIITRIVTFITYVCDGDDCTRMADSETGAMPTDPPPAGHMGYRVPWRRVGGKHLCPDCWRRQADPGRPVQIGERTP